MTQRLAAALKKFGHLRSDRVLAVEDGSPMTRDRVIKAMRGAQRIAGIDQGVHILRHTFCSHLGMRGAPARAIQELAGHADLSTTQRCMHLRPAATEDAIRSLEYGDHGPAKAGHYGSDGALSVEKLEIFWIRKRVERKFLREWKLVERATGIEPV